MPEYARRCLPCNHSFDTFATTSEVKDVDLCTFFKCPNCGGPTETDYSALNLKKGYTDFIGRGALSITEGCGPGAVDLARRSMGAEFAGCIRADGKCEFKDSRQRAAWDRRKEQLAEQKRRREEDAGKVRKTVAPITTREREETYQKIAEAARKVPD